MAGIKGWKRVKNQNKNWVSEEYYQTFNNGFVLIYKDAKYKRITGKEWVVAHKASSMTEWHPFKTKAKALAYAKSWMRKHPY